MIMKLAFVSLLALSAVTTAEEVPSLRGLSRELRDFQIGDYASARPQSVPGNYYNSPTTTTGGGDGGGTSGGNTGTIPLQDAYQYPLGECEGNCAGDSDCASGLVCFQRPNGNELVPGCTGYGSPGASYCYNPYTAAPVPNSSVGFRIKLYWMQGYYWRLESFERKWCMVCHSMALGANGCELGDDIHLETCAMSNTYFVFSPALSNGAVQIQVAGSDLCLDLSSTVYTQPVTLQICDSSNPDQFFTAGEGSFSSFRFELSPNGGGCLSNTHHPKQGEYIYNQDCNGPRIATASYWNKY
jgi:hypothetical protein